MTERERLAQLLADSDTPYALLDEVYLPLDMAQLKRTRNLRLIPGESRRRGGKYAYAEWAHVIGIFQTLICAHVTCAEGLRVLDVGSGAGLMAIACEPFVGGGGQYTGVEVSQQQVAFCREHYPAQGCSFIHLDTANAYYAPGQAAAPQAWPLDSASQDLVTAVSVWTHFGPADARFYLQEVARTLVPGGRALITAFVLDEAYAASLATRTSEPARFHGTPKDRWIFDQPVAEDEGWFCPAWAEVPEAAIAITERALHAALEAAGLGLVQHYPGNWKEVPGPFFQDVLVLERADAR